MARSALHITAAALAALAVALGCAACGKGGASAPTAMDQKRDERLDDEVGRLRDRLDALDVTPTAYARARLHRANIAFNAPDTVQLHEVKDIELVMSDDKSVTELKRRLQEAGAQVGVQIRAADIMEATLTGAAFKIEEITPTQQTVTAGVTRWKWEIEPTETGRRRLHLTLTALVPVDGRDRRRAVRTFERTLEVESVPVAMPAKLAGFFTDNWQWIATTLLIPVGAWAVRRRRTRPAGFEAATSRSGGAGARDT